MKVYFAADHAGFELKNLLLAFVRDELDYEVEDCGAFEFNKEDDYPDFVSEAAKAVARDPLGSRAVVLGASGQGEAMVANRIKGVRAAAYYGNPSVTQTDSEGEDLDMIESVRLHNDSNVLSIGAKFVSEEEAKQAIEKWLNLEFKNAPRHQRRITKIDELA